MCFSIFLGFNFIAGKSDYVLCEVHLFNSTRIVSPVASTTDTVAVSQLPPSHQELLHMGPVKWLLRCSVLFRLQSYFMRFVVASLSSSGLCLLFLPAFCRVPCALTHCDIIKKGNQHKVERWQQCCQLQVRLQLSNSHYSPRRSSLLAFRSWSQLVAISSWLSVVWAACLIHKWIKCQKHNCDTE